MKKKIFAIIMISVHILHIHIQSFISFNWEGKKNLNQLDQGFAHVNIWVWKPFYSNVLKHHSKEPKLLRSI